MEHDGRLQRQVMTTTSKNGDQRIRVGVLAVAGLQARSAPSVAYVHDLIKQGYVGEVLSTTLIGSGMGWGPTVEPYNAYLNDKKNGATMLSIALGHAADALCHCLGEVRELSATMTVRRKSFTIA